MDSDFYKTVWDCFLERAMGLTQQKLADIIGKPQSFVAKVEQGDRRLDVIEFLNICEVLNVDSADFLRKIKDY